MTFLYILVGLLLAAGAVYFFTRNNQEDTTTTSTSGRPGRTQNLPDSGPTTPHKPELGSDRMAELMGNTKKELLAMAKEQNVMVSTRMSKRNIAAAIEHAESEGLTEPTRK